MDTPEPVENARESFGNIEYEVDDALSHVILEEPLTEERGGETLIPAGEKLDFTYLDHFDGDWVVHVGYDPGYGETGYSFLLSEHDVEWVYESEVSEKAEEAEDLLREAQVLLDEIWGETRDTSAEELTKRVYEMRLKLRQDYL